MNNDKSPKIAIIGAGFAGIILANRLKRQYHVTIFEKSRGVSGRLASRTRDQFTFDFGSQFFTAKNPEFKNFLLPYINCGILEPWCGNFVEIDDYQITYRRPWGYVQNHLVASPKMTQFCKELARDLRIEFETKITKINKNSQNDKWQLFDENEVIKEFDWVLFAIPAQQLYELITPKISFFNDIKNIRMLSCYALMLGLEEFIDIPFDMALVKNSLISWISCEHSKPSRNKVPAYTILARNSWADANIDDDIQEVKQKMIDEFKKITNQEDLKIKHCDIHRWRYANIGKQNNNSKFLLDLQNKIGACGDWNIQGRVEAGFISANHLAEELIFKVLHK